VFINFADFVLQQLRQASVRRFQQAFRPGTRINQRIQIQRYYTFCRRFHLCDVNPPPAQLTWYIEYLSQNLKSSQTVRNYLSAVSLLHRQLGLDCLSMQSHQVTTMLRSVDQTLRLPIASTLPITVPMLHQLVSCCQQLGTWGRVFKCALLFCFFGFLRQSNVAPRSLNQFDVTRDAIRSDVRVHSQGLRLLLKWTKTHQTSQRPIYICLPRIPGSSLCPTRAFLLMCSTFPTTSHSMPLLVFGSKGSPPTVVTTRMLAKQLKLLIVQLGLPPSQFTLHSLRKGGATFCHSLGIPLEQIKAHGTWSTDTVWTYINPDQQQQSRIATTMSQAVLSQLTNK
jgi:hypothetical protein